MRVMPPYIIRRCLAAANNCPPVALTVRLQEAVDRWPVDPTKKHCDIRVHLEKRARHLISCNNALEQLEEEAVCLERLTANVHRDSYPVPLGLGGPPPIVAATGLDLSSTSAILTAGGDPKREKRLISRLLRFFS
ncbi:hypothetical transcript [Echinococcus multilocularis]|uniref:Hypothetical transcript n=1 Tax=Echinococcus multilocularis TaxID=6211 RepID=A0A087W097_ECHMU|nr:hypothetical transcript [Echinococcus multilocularis]